MRQRVSDAVWQCIRVRKGQLSVIHERREPWLGPTKLEVRNNRDDASAQQPVEPIGYPAALPEAMYLHTGVQYFFATVGYSRDL
jgi:hypothetical protein